MSKALSHNAVGGGALGFTTGVSVSEEYIFFGAVQAWNDFFFCKSTFLIQSL